MSTAQTSRPWQHRRVLVTGATGMVGSALTARLVSEGAHVVALVPDVDPQSELYRGGTFERINVINGRLEDFPTVERAVVSHEVSTIFHLGAQTIVSTAFRSPRATFESNVQGTWNVLDAARQHSDLVSSVVVASSDKAYGEHANLPYTESMSLDGTYPYEASKSMTDIVARAYARSYETPVVVARCGNIFGPGDLNWSRIVPGTFRSILLGHRPELRSNGTFLRDYLHVDEVVDAYFALDAVSATHRGEAFNFSSEAPLTVMQMYKACCLAAGVPDLEPLVLDNAPGEIKHQYLSAEKARETLGWTTKMCLEDGLSGTYGWYAHFFGGRND